MQPSEIEDLPFYEYEYYIIHLIDTLKEKKNAEENGSDGHPSMQKMMKDAKSQMPKIQAPSTPKFPSMSLPKMNFGK